MSYEKFGIEIPHYKTSGQIKTKCPKCSASRKNKKDLCLSVNLDEGVWNCHNCGWTDTIKRKQKQYTLPVWENKTELSDKVVEWFASRNISQDTLRKMKVTDGLEFMPQVGTKRHVVKFNYFRDGQCINVKYRDAEKNFKMVSGAELIFYNLDGIKGKDTAYIVEGEMDCLTMIQAGYENTVSVPNGASKGSSNMQYLDNCHRYFEGMRAVYILTDNDEPGKKLGDELARRIGIEKCFRVDLGEYKDINEAYSKGARISDILASHKPFPIYGVTTINDHWDEVEDIAKNGFPKGWRPRGALSKRLEFHPGYLTIVTGIPGHGKSEWLDYILTEISFLYNLRGAYFSPENKPAAWHIMKLAAKLLGKSFNKASGGDRERVKRYLNDRVNFIELSAGYTIDSILERVRQCVLSRGVNWYVLDPWNRIEHQYNDSETKYISQVLDKITAFNEQNGVHCFLVAHPTKMRRNPETGRYDVPGPYDISGSANWFNKADNFISVYREPADESNPGANRVSINVYKVKFDHWGERGQTNMYYNPDARRYDAEGEGIDVTDWLLVGNRQLTFPELSSDRTEEISQRDVVLASELEPEIEDDLPF